LGVETIHGIDGDYVDRALLEIPGSAFTCADLSKPVSLGRTFDLVQSLEVGEHIVPEASDIFVDQLIAHSSGFVLFSAAPPGQGGEFHINERSYEFWRALFRTRGFRPLDYVRPLIIEDRSISFWYRFNTLLYARDDLVSSLPLRLRRTQVGDDT